MWVEVISPHQMAFLLLRDILDNIVDERGRSLLWENWRDFRKYSTLPLGGRLNQAWIGSTTFTHKLYWLEDVKDGDDFLVTKNLQESWMLKNYTIHFDWESRVHFVNQVPCIYKKSKTKVGLQSNVNLSMLILSCSRIRLVHGGVCCLPYSGWTHVCNKKI